MPHVTWYRVEEWKAKWVTIIICVMVLSSCGCHGYSLVHGFLDRQDAHDMLQECAPGTFLIRFSLLYTMYTVSIYLNFSLIVIYLSKLQSNCYISNYNVQTNLQYTIGCIHTKILDGHRMPISATSALLR